MEKRILGKFLHCIAIWAFSVAFIIIGPSTYAEQTDLTDFEKNYNSAMQLRDVYLEQTIPFILAVANCRSTNIDGPFALVIKESGTDKTVLMGTLSSSDKVSDYLRDFKDPSVNTKKYDVSFIYKNNGRELEKEYKGKKIKFDLSYYKQITNLSDETFLAIEDEFNIISEIVERNVLISINKSDISPGSNFVYQVHAGKNMLNSVFKFLFKALTARQSEGANPTIWEIEIFYNVNPVLKTSLENKNKTYDIYTSQL